MKIVIYFKNLSYKILKLGHSSISSERKTNVCKSDKNLSGKKATETITTTKSVVVEKTQVEFFERKYTNKIFLEKDSSPRFNE